MKYRRKNSCIKGHGSIKVEVNPTQVWEQVGRTDQTFVTLENNDVTLIVDKKELCSEWESFQKTIFVRMEKGERNESNITTRNSKSDKM